MSRRPEDQQRVDLATQSFKKPKNLELKIFKVYDAGLSTKDYTLENYMQNQKPNLTLKSALFTEFWVDKGSNPVYKWCIHVQFYCTQRAYVQNVIQGYNARKVNFSCVHIETSSLWVEILNKNRCISVRLVSEEAKSIKF